MAKIRPNLPTKTVEVAMNAVTQDNPIQSNPILTDRLLVFNKRIRHVQNPNLYAEHDVPHFY